MVHTETSKVSFYIKFCPLCGKQVIAIQKLHNSEYFSLPFFNDNSVGDNAGLTD